MNWQPIETAPVEDFNPEKWFMAHSPSVLVFPGPRIAQYGYTQKGKGRWKSWIGVEQPTHWMPLPPPPQ